MASRVVFYGSPNGLVHPLLIPPLGPTPLTFEGGAYAGCGQVQVPRKAILGFTLIWKFLVARLIPIVTMQRGDMLLSLLSPQMTQNRQVIPHLGSGCTFTFFYLLGLLVAPVSPPFLLFLDPRSEALSPLEGS